jgi:AcrR family transcriptional regulator
MDTSARAQRMEQVLDVAEEMILNNPTASLEDIARKAGVGVATLYRYYESREGLVRALFVRVIDMLEELRNEISKSKDGFGAILDTLIVKTSPRLIRMKIFMNENVWYEYAHALQPLHDTMMKNKESFDKLMLGRIVQAQHDGELSDKLPAAWLNLVIMNLMFALIEYSDHCQSLEEAQELMKLALKERILLK